MDILIDIMAIFSVTSLNKCRKQKQFNALIRVIKPVSIIVVAVNPSISTTTNGLGWRLCFVVCVYGGL